MNDSPISILFVDDEPTILRAVTLQLASSPYEVLTAAGSCEALQLLDNRTVDVIVADIEMPDISGIELCQIAARDYPEMLRMLLTGHANMERTLQAINTGEVARFFMKPLAPAVFLDEMERFVERIRATRARHVHDSQARRRVQLDSWLDENFPGAHQVSRTGEGEILLDLVELIAQVDDSGMPPAARDLLRKDA